jgi:hypothetical protein
MASTLHAQRWTDSRLPSTSARHNVWANLERLALSSCLLSQLLASHRVVDSHLQVLPLLLSTAVPLQVRLLAPHTSPRVPDARRLTRAAPARAQCYLLFRHPRFYSRHRSSVVIGVRLLRALAVAQVYLDPSFAHALHASSTAADGSWRRLAHVLTPFAGASLVNAISMPLRAPQQAALLALLAAVNALLGGPIINCSMQHPGSRLGGTAARLCSTLMNPLLAAGRIFVPAPPRATSSCAGPQAGLSLALFLFLWLGAALPLQLTLWAERWLEEAHAGGAAAAAAVHPRGEAGPADAAGAQHTRQPPGLLALALWLFFSAWACCVAVSLLVRLPLYDSARCAWAQGG